ncbi:hypothetical protein [Marimonas arenosa]|uniref:hypothetical protein n=1 Tax=Marimonas arenosa TaxID=1795305 RepID=UPI0027D25340|nr:hypothetical protein [Marimonas arenosa]
MMAPPRRVKVEIWRKIRRLQSVCILPALRMAPEVRGSAGKFAKAPHADGTAVPVYVPLANGESVSFSGQSDE